MTEIVIKTKTRKAGKGGTRKIGRMARKPAHQRYNAERRWEKNKEKRLKKAAKRGARLKARKAKKAAASQA